MSRPSADAPSAGIAPTRPAVIGRRLWRVGELVLVWAPPFLLIAPLLFLFVGAFSRTWDSRGLSGLTLDGLTEGFAIVGDSIAFSLALAAGSAIIATAVATPLAYALQSGNGRLMRLVREVVILPVVLPALLLAMGMILAYPALQGGWQILLMAHVAQTIPFALWPVVSALLVLDVAMFDMAGRTLGASPWQRFTLLILPNVWRSAVTGGATAFVISFSETASSLFLSSAQYRPIGVVLVDSFINLDQRISAAAAAIFTLALLPALVILELTLVFGSRRARTAPHLSSSTQEAIP
jgi:ABC-type spermidine/putrescine transport system permease subunit II